GRDFAEGMADELVETLHAANGPPQGGGGVEEVEDPAVGGTGGGIVVEGMPQWTPQGPAPLLGGQTAGLIASGNAVAGAVQAIAVQPGNPDVVFIGTTNGGVWRTL